MEGVRNYKRRGTPDFPVASYLFQRKTEYATTLHWHPEMEIIQFCYGQGVLQVDGSAIPLSGKMVCFIKPNEDHNIRTSGDTRLRSLIFAKEVVNFPDEHFFKKEFVTPLWDGRLRLPRVLTPDHPAFETVYAQMEMLKDCYLYAPNYKATRLAIITSICAAIFPYCTLDETAVNLLDNANNTVRRCLLYLHNHYWHKLTLKKIAESLHLNPSYLCTLFREHTGQTIFTHLTHIRIEHAALLLRTTDLPVSRVAEQCGFCSESLLYKNFKDIMDMTPVAYRKSNQPAKED